MEGEGEGRGHGHGHGRRSQRATAKKAKKLGRVARISVRKNDEATERFIADMRAGRAPAGRLLGIVERAEGGGRFEVKVDGEVQRMPLRGLLRGRGGFHRNPDASTAARRGSTVLVQHGEIISVLAPDQVERVRRALSSSSSERRSSNHLHAPRRRLTTSSNHNGGPGFEWNRAANVKGASARRSMVASLDPTTKAPKRNHRVHAPPKGAAEGRSWFSFF